MEEGQVQGLYKITLQCFDDIATLNSTKHCSKSRTSVQIGSFVFIRLGFLLRIVSLIAIASVSPFVQNGRIAANYIVVDRFRFLYPNINVLPNQHSSGTSRLCMVEAHQITRRDYSEGSRHKSSQKNTYLRWATVLRNPLSHWSTNFILCLLINMTAPFKEAGNSSSNMRYNIKVVLSLGIDRL